ncbi:methyltransferase family protein [Pontibacter ummariensis]|uniref:Methyltransferase domain-containing protein n=2 Tax=Pontibacter ummariensis TaxID=1610492 RepID=A0A239KQ46_9BACT|nr:methyltransferase family protein [Pontibacter ummariensis]SNT19304.1 Methyltransferase domain-containing protein [Pontibacter ummariensis]
MWGFEPADSAIATLNLFRENRLNKILLPGFGYGRNAKIFTDAGLKVTGIEISETAIDLAKKHYGDDVRVYHGSVSAMPFDQELYDGIFCYALIQLLNQSQLLLPHTVYTGRTFVGHNVPVCLKHVAPVEYTGG